MLHQIFYALVKEKGRSVLSSPYLCGMVDDLRAFREWSDRPYRCLLRDLIEQQFVARMLEQKKWDEKFVDELVAQYQMAEGVTDKMVKYLLQSIAYAAGWCSEPTFESEAAAGQTSAPEVALGQDVVTYKAHGSEKTIGTMIPAAMANPVNRNLNRIADEEGPILDFVSFELHMEPEQVESVLSGEQIDGVAMALRQMMFGQGFILSDATGIGKGRQLAALLYWSTLQGCVPVFVTEKSILFSDLYRDLKDIGCKHLKPFILNSDREARVMDNENRCVVGLPSAQEMDYFRQTHQLPEGYDFLALTYSQTSRNETKNWKLACVLDLVRDSYLILDESHNATGAESNTGRFFQRAVQEACGVVFASATYAKNCATMPLYALKTAIADARIGSAELIDIVASGGPILQEELAKGLVASGSMVRRERDMSGVERELRVEKDPARVARVCESYDKVIELIQDLHDFDTRFVMPYLESIDIAKQLRKTMSLPDTVVFDVKSLRVDRESFATRMIPTIQQLILATKTDLAVETTLEVLRSGKKPVVEIQRTLESQLDALVGVDEELASFEFSQILRRSLMALFHYTLVASEKVVKSNRSGKTGTRYSKDFSFGISALCGHFGNNEPQAAFAYLLKRINQTVTGLPISPIDYFIYRIRKEGYRVEEMTQRRTYLDYQGVEPVRRLRRKKIDKKLIANGFNDGTVDCLIANRVAATGISLHASETFADQRQRVMIVLESQASADMCEQFQGRIDRTGQVIRGSYITLVSPIAAEMRFMMMNEHKLRSLSSIVRADQRTKTEITDILNEYGGRCVDEYLKDHLEMFDLMPELRNNSRYLVGEVLVSQFMKGLALLKSTEQERVLDEIMERYNTMVDYLTEVGENELEARVLPLDAKLDGRIVFAAGNPDSQSLFGKPAYLETVDAKVLRKPYTSNEIKKLMDTLISPSDVTVLVTDAYADKRKAIAKRYKDLRAQANAKLEEIRKLQSEGAEYTPSRIKQLLEQADNKKNEQTQLDKAQEEMKQMRDLLNCFKKGAAVGVPLSLVAEGEITDSNVIDYVSLGMFLGVRLSSDKISRSTIRLVFAVNDGRRRIELTLAQEDKLQTIIRQGRVNLMQRRLQTVNLNTWNGLCPQNARETLYIVTGNILLGIWRARQFGAGESSTKSRRLAQCKGHGHLVMYTDNAGRVKHGYLMPRIFRPRDITVYGQ